MITVRRSGERGHFDHGWLNTYHTFSFADYRDPNHVRFRSLRVMNEDCVAPGQGFGAHAHENMEIISYVLDGALEHRDSLGNGSVLRRGTFQRMSAGTGVTHSEFNHSPGEPVHFYQIWLYPERAGLEPGYEERAFDPQETAGRLRLVASRDGRDGSMTVHQDASIYLGSLASGGEVRLSIAAGRHVWLQVLRGAAELNGVPLAAGDGASASGERALTIRATGDAEVMLFDLA